MLVRLIIGTTSFFETTSDQLTWPTAETWFVSNTSSPDFGCSTCYRIYSNDIQIRDTDVGFPVHGDCPIREHINRKAG